MPDGRRRPTASTTVASRLFNVFGSRQALSNPYTGVLAIFAARLINGRRPLVFEDGLQRRDFVHVKDVARAFHLAMATPWRGRQVINIGSGRSYAVRSGAPAGGGARPSRAFARDQRPSTRRRHPPLLCRHRPRPGAARLYPAHRLETDLDELVGWLDGQEAEDRVSQATAELEARGLVA